MDYIAIIHKDPDSDFGVSFPDFPGCITAGRSLDEAKDMALEARYVGTHGYKVCTASEGSAASAAT